MKIAIVGAQCTGKTTLLNKIKESNILDGSYIFVNEIVRTLVKEKSIKINTEGDYDSQLLILQTHYNNACQYQNLVTDRGCVDAWAYALYNHNKGSFTDKEMLTFGKLFSQTLALYDKVFYLPI